MIQTYHFKILHNSNTKKFHRKNSRQTPGNSLNVVTVPSFQHKTKRFRTTRAALGKYDFLY